MSLITVENRVGRLCEIRAESGVTLQAMTQFRARLATVFQSVAGRVVICSDLTRCERIPEDVMAALVVIGRIDNPKIERHALLVDPTHAIAAQLERVVLDAGNPARRVFRRASELTPWLAEVVTPSERAQLEYFLGQRR